MSSAKKRRPIKNGIMKLLLALGSLTHFTENLIRVVRARAQAAGRSLFLLVVLAFMFAGLLMALWLSCLALLYVNLMDQHWTQQAGIVVVAGLNVFLLLLVVCLIRRASKQLDETLRVHSAEK